MKREKMKETEPREKMAAFMAAAFVMTIWLYVIARAYYFDPAIVRETQFTVFDSFNTSYGTMVLTHGHGKISFNSYHWFEEGVTYSVRYTITPGERKNRGLKLLDCWEVNP